MEDQCNTIRIHSSKFRVIGVLLHFLDFLKSIIYIFSYAIFIISFLYDKNAKNPKKRVMLIFSTDMSKHCRNKLS